MKNIVVQKYGGSSVSTVSNILSVAKRIIQTQQQGYQVVAVVSAMGNTTNELISLAKKISEQPSKRELDLLLSVGERVSMSLLAMAIQELGGKAKSFTGSQSGIITTNAHLNASIIEVKPGRIQKALEEGCIAIVAGFQGMSQEREVTTLGRGGSDTTAVALTAALQAKYCEICSDVSGVYSTDPRVVSSALLLPELRLETAISMSEAGAKVLHAEALRWCQRAGVTLIANATKNAFGCGTHIVPENIEKEKPVIAFDRELLWVENISNEQKEKIKTSIRWSFSFPQQEIVIIDQRNNYVSLSGKEIGSIRVVGEIEKEAFLKQEPEYTILLQWQEQRQWTILVERDDIDEIVRRLHSWLFSMCDD